MTDEYDESRAIVRVEYLLATEPFQSTEETRYYLNGVFIEPHPRAGAMIVATDGHMLSCIHDEEAIVSGPPRIWGRPWKSILAAPFREWKKKHKGITDMNVYADLRTWKHKGTNSEVRLVAAEKAAEVFNGRGKVITTLVATPNDTAIDGTFPEYRRVVPTANTADKFFPAWYQGRYMAKIAAFGMAVQAALKDDGRADVSSPMCVFASGDGSGPGVALFAAPNCFVVIMPVTRVRPVLEGGLPAWFHDHGVPKPEFADKTDLRVVA